MRIATIGAALLSVVGFGAWVWMARTPGTATVPTGGPIILISIDTLRADRLPAYGYTVIETPHLDSLAADGVLFERAWSHAPLTLPAHMSMLTGELPFEHGVRDNVGFAAKPGQRFLQHALGELGYATGGFISSYVLRRQTGIHQGFGHYDDTLPPASPDSPLGEMQRSGAETVAAATKWIGQQTTPKFFAFVHIYEPHLPYTPPARFAGSHPYDGEVAYSDEIVGSLIADLRARGLYDRATIVLLSDHGEGLGDHGEDVHGLFLYRSTMQVPLIVKLPGSRRGGTRVSAPAQHVDLPATLLTLAGGLGDGRLAAGQGRSLLPVLDGTGSLPDATIYSETLSPRYHFGWSALYALNDDRYRLIRAPRDELYDLSQDPGELRSLAGERPHVHAAMRGALDALIARGGVSAPSAVSEEDRGRLAALGYVGTQRGAIAESDNDDLPDPKDKIDVLRRYTKATQLAGDGRIEEAIPAFKALVADDPSMVEVWLRLAAVYTTRGRHTQALEAYRAVIERDPKDPAALTGAATTLVRLGRLAEARTHAELAIDVSPAESHALLAHIALNARDFAAARRHAALAEQVDPTLPMRAAVEGRVAHAEGNYPAAVAALEEAARRLARRTKQLPDVHYFLGDALARLDRYAEAEAHFLAEIRFFPASLRPRAGLAMLYRATGRVRASEQTIAELLRAAPTPEGYAVAADLWAMFGEPGRAAAVRDRAGGAKR